MTKPDVCKRVCRHSLALPVSDPLSDLLMLQVHLCNARWFSTFEPPEPHYESIFSHFVTIHEKRALQKRNVNSNPIACFHPLSWFAGDAE